MPGDRANAGDETLAVERGGGNLGIGTGGRFDDIGEAGLEENGPEMVARPA